MRAETPLIKEKNYAGSSIKAPKKSVEKWKKVIVIVMVVTGFIFVAAAIAIPIYVVSAVAVATVNLPSQCSTYTLDTDATRLATYSVVATGCDVTLYSTPTWVRFGGTASRLASTPPLIYRCGTSATGWYTGPLPSTVGSNSTGVVCFTWTSSICDFQRTITVLNCNTFYIYLLVSPTQCALRYCTE